MTRAQQKQRGRPATGRGVTIGVRCHEDLIGALDNWRRTQADLPTRATAIRRLVQDALRVTRTQPSRNRKAASKAHDMAGQEIDRLADQSLPAEERERRKRRLTKGPGEFRDIREGAKPKR